MFNIYCDESCHLPNDDSDVMVLGSIVVSEENKQKFYEEIRALKKKHGMSSWNEIKWTKVSNSKVDFYFELIDWFFEEDINFRAIVARNKKYLDHNKYSGGDHDSWYYKMYFLLLGPLLKPGKEYKAYIDIKDTKGGQRVDTLQNVLRNNMYDFKGEVLKDVKQVVSSDSELLQLCDLIIGCISYYHRGLYDSNSDSGKNKLISRLINYHQRNLKKSTFKSERKFNLFIWLPEGVR